MAGLTNRDPVRDSRAGTPLDNIIVQCSFTLTPNMVIFEKIAPVQTIFSHLVIIHGLIFFLVHYKVL